MFNSSQKVVHDTPFNHYPHAGIKFKTDSTNNPHLAMELSVTTTKMHTKNRRTLKCNCKPTPNDSLRINSRAHFNLVTHLRIPQLISTNKTSSWELHGIIRPQNYNHTMLYQSSVEPALQNGKPVDTSIYPPRSCNSSRQAVAPDTSTRSTSQRGVYFHGRQSSRTPYVSIQDSNHSVISGKKTLEFKS